MIFRKRKLNWHRAVSELAIVAVGVLLALAADGWLTGVGLRRTESASLARLADDMHIDLVDIRGNLERTRRSYSAARWLMQHRHALSPSPDSLSARLTDFTACSTMSVNTSEYTALKASGQLGILRDADFRQRLVNHYERYPYLSALYDLDCSAMEEAIAAIESEIEFDIDITGEAWPIILTGEARNVLSNPTFQRSVAYAARTRHFRSSMEEDEIAELEALRNLATELANR